jgi:hypothetical protein
MKEAPEEQKGCYKGSRGCKDQITIDTIIVKQAIEKRRNLSMTYIDYRKAFDSIPHSCLLEILEMCKINPILINFMKKAMEKWTTVLHILDGTQTIQSKEITIKK